MQCVIVCQFCIARFGAIALKKRIKQGFLAEKDRKNCALFFEDDKILGIFPAQGFTKARVSFYYRFFLHGVSILRAVRHFAGKILYPHGCVFCSGFADLPEGATAGISFWSEFV